MGELNYDRERAYGSVGPGWRKLVDECFRLCDSLGAPYRVVQVKEKFGGLRFSFRTDTPDAARTAEWDERRMSVLKKIRSVQRRSMRTCEECGDTGGPAGDGMVVATLCDDCLGEDERGRVWVRLS